MKARAGAIREAGLTSGKAYRENPPGSVGWSGVEDACQERQVSHKLRRRMSGGAA